MAYFEFPHTRTYDSDLGWLIKHFGLMSDSVESLESWAATHKEEYNELADKVDGLINNLVDVISPWDSSIAYHIFSIVEYQGTNYIAVQDVPVGAMITNTDYWQPANTVVQQINAIGLVASDTQEAVEKIPLTVYPRRKYYRPEDYGAIVNDVSIDNAPYIRQAIVNANNNGGIVLLSEGTYYTQTTINIPEHIYGVHVIGTGDSYLGDNFGTIISYSGTAQALKFTGGVWGCVFEDFTIIATSSGAGCVFTDASSDTAERRARMHRTSFNRVSFLFRGTGFTLANPAYVWFNQCRFRGVPETSDSTGRTGLYIGDITDNYNSEYVTLTDCQIVPDVYIGNENPSYGIYQVEGVHITAYNLDITDADYGWYIKTSYDTGFINSYDLDIARAKYGVVVDIDGHSLQDSVFQNTVFTAHSSTDPDSRMFVFKRTSGGDGYNAKFKALNNSIRAGQGSMTYWVEETGWALAPGLYEFTFLMSEVPKTSFITRQNNPNYSTMGYLGLMTEDLNNFTDAGFVPYRLSGSSANSPGFDCMLMVYANPANSVQIAIPMGTGGVNTFAWRIYTAASNRWSAWATLEKTT